MNNSHGEFVGYYHEFKDRLFTYLMIRVNFNREQAEDLLMDVILKAYQHFKSFDPKKGSFKTWIFTLTHNHLVNYWRDERRHKTDSLEQLEENGFVSSVAPEDTASPRIENENIQQALSLMNNSEREVISLRYFEDLGFKEIAKILEKNEGAVRTELSRALKHFSEIYKKLFP